MNYENKIDQILDRAIKNACERNDIPLSQVTTETDLDLIESKLFDSIDFIQLLAEFEEELSIEIDFSDYLPEEFTKRNHLRRILLEILNQ